MQSLYEVLHYNLKKIFENNDLFWYYNDYTDNVFKMNHSNLKTTDILGIVLTHKNTLNENFEKT